MAYGDNKKTNYPMADKTKPIRKTTSSGGTSNNPSTEIPKWKSNSEPLSKFDKITKSDKGEK